MPRIRFLFACLLTVGLLACSKPAEEQTQAPAPESPAPSETTTTAAPAAPATTATPPPATPEPAAAPAPPARKAAPAAAAPEPARPAPPVAVKSAAVAEPSGVAKTSTIAPAPVTVIVASGTPLEIRLNSGLSSGTAKSDDRFEGTLSQDLEHNGKVLAPKGSVIFGRVSDVAGSGRVQGRARMSLSLTELNVGDDKYDLKTNTLSFEAESTQGRDAKAVGGSAGVGALIGAIAGGKKGAAIGAAIGAGAGTATVMVTKGKEVVFEPEQKFNFKLEQDLEIKVR